MKELLEKMFKDDNVFLSLRHNDGTFLGKIVHDRKLKKFYYIENYEVDLDNHKRITKENTYYRDLLILIVTSKKTKASPIIDKGVLFEEDIFEFWWSKIYNWAEPRLIRINEVDYELFVRKGEFY